MNDFNIFDKRVKDSQSKIKKSFLTFMAIKII
jgi:hypothetical protein